jgi:molybdopterin synthase catalytic subunit
MRVRVRLFAALRDQVGSGEVELELPDGAAAGSVPGAVPGLAAAPEGLLLAVNRRYVAADHVLAEGDEVALIPPVSGGAGGPYLLTEQPIDVEAVAAAVADERAGAIATFRGTTRVHSRGRTVLHLDYEAYEGMAEQELERIGTTLLEKHGLCGIAITHRVGRVAIGETSVAIAASAPHRAAAFDACREAIDTLKVTVPLWKKEVYEGGEEWIGRGS